MSFEDGRHVTARERRDWVGPVATLGVVLAFEIFHRSRFYDRTFGTALLASVLLAVVLVAAYRGGLRSGLVSAGLTVLYAAYVYSTPSALPVHYEPGVDTRRILVVGTAIPVVAVLVGFLRERVDRLLARERAARDEVEGILRSIADAFFAVDRDWRFTYVNDRAEELFERPREELLGRSLWLAIPELADYCLLDVIEEGVGLRRLATAHRDPAKEEQLLQETELRPVPFETPITEVLRSGESCLIDDDR